MTDPHTHAATMRGIIAVLAAMAIFVSSDSVVKLSGETLPVTQIMAIRGLMAVVLMGAVAAASVDISRWHLIAQPRVMARASIESVVAVLFLIALPHLPLADITANQQVTPIALTVLSGLVLKGAVGWRRWAAVFAGFVGVVMVIQPTGQGISLIASPGAGATLARRRSWRTSMSRSVPTPMARW